MSTNDQERSPATGNAVPAAHLLERSRRDLQELGLPPYQAQVLLALLNTGSANSTDLARLSGVPRTSIYQVMEALIRRGLAKRIPTLGAAMWVSHDWKTVVDVLDTTADEHLQQHRARTARLRQALAEIMSRTASFTV